MSEQLTYAEIKRRLKKPIEKQHIDYKTQGFSLSPRAWVQLAILQQQILLLLVVSARVGAVLDFL